VDADKARRELISLAQPASRLPGELGKADTMEAVFALVRKIAPWNVSTLITGETGTGKELVARTIHRLSPRSARAFVAFSCANLPETLVDDELFGHERGAFTGAVSSRRGRFEAAHEGTLFLDEIGDLPFSLQAKLLRVLQERAFERLGSQEVRKVDVRLLSATHRNLEEMVAHHGFREDLYHRLNVVQIGLPPLRERRNGIALLADHFLERSAKEFGKPSMHLSKVAVTALEEYDWPGNVRELENVIQRAVVLAEDAIIELWHLPAALCSGFRQHPPTNSYSDHLREFKRRLVIRTIGQCGGNKAEAARVLGLARGYLHRLITELDIKGEDFGFEAKKPAFQSTP